MAQVGTQTSKDVVLDAKRGETCLIRLVGYKPSDCLIKVYPAECKQETIWMNKQAGKERWSMIERIFTLHAPRTGLIPKPAPLMSEDLKTRTLQDADIPLVTLTDYVLPAPPPEEPKLPKEDFKGDAVQTNDRLDKMEKNIETMTATINALANVMSKMTPPQFSNATTTETVAETPVEPVKKKRGRPRKS